MIHKNLQDQLSFFTIEMQELITSTIKLQNQYMIIDSDRIYQENRLRNLLQSYEVNFKGKD